MFWHRQVKHHRQSKLQLRKLFFSANVKFEEEDDELKGVGSSTASLTPQVCQRLPLLLLGFMKPLIK